MKNTETEKKFVDIVHKYERVIYKVCSFYVSGESPMSDLYQEAVYNLWKGFLKFRNECSMSTWIYRVVLNTCISGLRKEKRQLRNYISVSVLENVLPEPDDTEGQETIDEMYRLIDQLKTLEKAVVLLYLEDKSYQEIAEITGLTIGNVAMKLKRSKDKLKEMSDKKNNGYGIE